MNSCARAIGLAKSSRSHKATAKLFKYVPKFGSRYVYGFPQGRTEAVAKVAPAKGAGWPRALNAKDGKNFYRFLICELLSKIRN